MVNDWPTVIIACVSRPSQIADDCQIELFQLKTIIYEIRAKANRPPWLDRRLVLLLVPLFIILFLLLRPQYPRPEVAHVDDGGHDEAEHDGEADADAELVFAAYVKGSLRLLNRTLLFSTVGGQVLRALLTFNMLQIGIPWNVLDALW